MKFFEYDIDKLGFGCMRFPFADGAIDIEATKELVDKFMDAGFTYYDTAWTYTGSEKAIGEALVKRYPRESFQIATKVCPWTSCTCEEDLDKQLQECLSDMGVDYVDFLMVHNIGGNRTQAAENVNAWEAVKRMKEAGLAKHIGFSTHAFADEVEDYILNHEGVEFVQMQLNYFDWDNPAYDARKVYETIRKYDLPVVVMEPVKGGLLADVSSQVSDIFSAVEPDRSPAAWALRFAADHEGIMAVLSGMNQMDHMEENIAALQNFDGMSEEERAAIDKAIQAMADSQQIQCTSCEYCLKVCPQTIDIPGVMTALNMFMDTGNAGDAGSMLGAHAFMNSRGFPFTCTQCGACETACPQNIDIRAKIGMFLAEIGPHMGDREMPRMRQE